MQLQTPSTKNRNYDDDEHSRVTRIKNRQKQNENSYVSRDYVPSTHTVIILL